MRDQVVSHYRLIEKLGIGSHGEVWRGVHASFEEMGVAVKLLHPELARDEDFIQRLKRECLVLHTLQHENIVGFRELVLSGDRPAMVMEYVEGIDGFERAQQGPVSSPEILKIGRDSLKGLAFAHKKGVVHRDLKPSNLFLCADGTTKLLDFGIAKAVSGSHATKTGTIQGTLQYMAPEVFSGKGGTVSVDIYALGLSLWELITGASACPEGSMPEQMGWHMMQGLESILETTDTPMWVNEDMLAVIKRMAAKDPADRYESIEAVLSDWEALSESSSPAVSPHASAESIPPGTVTLDLGKVQEQVENKSANTLPPDSIVLSKEAVMEHLDNTKKSPESSQSDSVVSEPAKTITSQPPHTDASSGGVNKNAIFIIAGLGCSGLAAMTAVAVGFFLFVNSSDDVDIYEGKKAAPEVEDDTGVAKMIEALNEQYQLDFEVAEFDGVSDRIRSISATPVSGEWDDAVKLILLQNYDYDSSGSLDANSEIDSISCSVWIELDRLVASTDSDLMHLYGFDGSAWIGYALGFSEYYRSKAYSTGKDCISSSVGAKGDPGSRVAAITAEPTSNEWDDAVKTILLEAYDHDRNGVLDEVDEISSIDCSVWRNLSSSARSEGWDLFGLYGFDGEGAWIGGLLGFSEYYRSEAYSNARLCL